MRHACRATVIVMDKKAGIGPIRPQGLRASPASIGVYGPSDSGDHVGSARLKRSPANAPEVPAGPRNSRELNCFSLENSLDTPTPAPVRCR